MKSKMFLIILLFVAAVSCTKKDTDVQPTLSDGFPRIRTYTTGDSTDFQVWTLGYDASGRQVSCALGDTIVYRVAYSAGNVEMDFYDYTGTVDGKSVFILNSEGLAISSFIILGPGMKGYSTIRNFPYSADTIFRTYQYDANGYLIGQTQLTSYDTTVCTYVIENGNTVSETYYTHYGTGTISYQFYDNKISTIGNQNMGIGFLGKQNRNLIQSRDAFSVLITYDYEFDSKDRVIKESSSGTSDLTRFTYTD